MYLQNLRACKKENRQLLSFHGMDNNNMLRVKAEIILAKFKLKRNYFKQTLTKQQLQQQ